MSTIKRIEEPEEAKKCEWCFKQSTVKGYYDFSADILYDVCLDCYRELSKEDEK